MTDPIYAYTYTQRKDGHDLLHGYEQKLSVNSFVLSDLSLEVKRSLLVLEGSHPLDFNETSVISFSLI